MKHLLPAFLLLVTCTIILPDTAAAAPAPSGRARAKNGWLSRHLKKRRPPVLPYERALRRNELFRS
ncbi:hypothetical protein K3G63_19395 [Hymenobacter sp. HSC-4F20]|uniref:hypothetical protein n=1 Tax=Hymenobacter sp. HSC-4F20 TaxID=2864135 RepID=UPI001C72F001|nr:hypothetical protein [Hymenobacter sp. HSC-4F20]MBX0292618.1 hypothetical protein [Hymenobacter sp. HSC-4F20]